MSGLWEKVLIAVVEKTRLRAGHNELPSYGIIDSQSVKTIYDSDERGIDGGKKIKGRKRHIVVDTMGNLLSVIVHAANIHDTKSGKKPAIHAYLMYNRNVEKAKTLWVNKTGTQNVTEWCNKYFIPISWVLSAKQFDIVRIIKDIQEDHKVDPTALMTALREFDNGDFSVLQNASAVRYAFLSQIGEKYKTIWDSDELLLRGRLTTNGKLTSDIYSWGAANKVAEIRRVFDAYLKETQVIKAKERVREMPEVELRDKVLALLEKSPEQYEIFLK